MTTQSQNNRDSELFCISQNAVIEAPSQPARSCCESLRMASVRQSDKRQPDGCPTGSTFQKIKDKSKMMRSYRNRESLCENDSI